MDIEELIDSLSMNNTNEVQQDAISKLINIEQEKLYMLVTPKSKSHWENAALVIKGIGYPKIEPIMPDLIEWIADLNWPGAYTVFELLASLDKKVLIPFIEDASIKAIKNNDEEWLYYIKKLANKVKVEKCDFRDSKNFDVLDKIE